MPTTDSTSSSAAAAPTTTCWTSWPGRSTRGGRDAREPPDVDRHERLLLSRVEGQLLPGEDAGQGHAALLRRQVLDGRDQQHLLPHAQGGAVAWLVRAGARGLRLRDQGAEAHHARPAAQGV